jgi:CDP-diacylglycerol--glycerol-3-phosphate 3-phosphatidyltransferase
MDAAGESEERGSEPRGSGAAGSQPRGSGATGPEPRGSGAAGSEPRRSGRRFELTRGRLLGYDRDYAPPPETLPGAPLNPWTIPNAIGFVRLALIPVFLVLALGSDDGRYAPASIIYAVIGGTDYLDGMAARLTGQFSRLGVLLDPVVDRLLVISGVVVCWHFELLPRWALALLVARELFMLVISQIALAKHIGDIKVNMLGRWAVWPTMFSIFLAMVSTTWVAEALLYLGLAMTLGATVLYVRDGLTALREPNAQSPAPGA